jgi:hypothetical protein
MIYFIYYLLVFNPLTLLIIYIAYTKTQGLLKKLITFIGAIIDLVVNQTWFTLIFWEFTKDYLLTKRVSRLKNTDGWRGNLAKVLCSLLNHFEKDHCK